MEYVLQTSNLTKIYGAKTVVSKVSINVPKGGIYGLIGRNGAGKTTLLRMAAGLCAATSGSLERFKSADAAKSLKRMGALIEQPALHLKMSAAENLEYYRLLLGVPEKSKIAELLSIVGLADAGRKKAVHFSLGMKQRLGIAIALLGDPDMLVLDEPINGLDPQGVSEVRDLIRTLNRSHDMTILISSHILSELSKIASHYGIIENGILLQELTTEALEQACRRCIRLTVDDIKRASGILETALKLVSYDIPDKNTIRVFEYTDIGRLNTTLVQAGVTVTGIQYAGNDIENYFLNLIAGGTEREKHFS
jgi:ABC-2 type transport system ATP-binding protein